MEIKVLPETVSSKFLLFLDCPSVQIQPLVSVIQLSPSAPTFNDFSITLISSAALLILISHCQSVVYSQLSILKVCFILEDFVSTSEHQ